MDLKVRTGSFPQPTFDIHWNEADSDLHMSGTAEINGVMARVAMARHREGNVTVQFYRAEAPESPTLDEKGFLSLPEEWASYDGGHLVVKGIRSTQPINTPYQMFVSLSEQQAWANFYASLDGREPGPEPTRPEREFDYAWFLNAWFDEEAGDAIYEAFGIKSWAEVMEGQKNL